MKKLTLFTFLTYVSFSFTSLCVASEDDLRPIEHKCPITLEVMKDPVVAADGHSYEREAISEHFKIRLTSPCTGKAITNTLISNHALKKMIEEWRPGRQDIQSELDNLDSRTISERVRSEFDAHATLFSSSKDEDIVVFLGNTGSGKSTLVNLLAGKQLAVNEEGRDYVLLNPDDKDAMSIGTGGDSETRYPKSIVVDGLRFFDFPGFNDTDGSVLNLVNAAFIRQILMKAKSVRLVIVVGEDQFTVDRGDSAKQLFEAMKRLFVVDEQNTNVIDNSIFVVTKSAAVELVKTKDFLISKTSGKNKEPLQKQLEFWHSKNSLWHMHTPQFKNYNELNSITKGILLNMIENLPPLRIAGINVSVLYPPETRRPLVRMFDHVMEKVLNNKFNGIRNLVSLSEIDHEIDFNEASDFWGKFYEEVCSDKSVDLLKEFCIDQYREAQNVFKERNEGKLKEYILSLKTKRNIRKGDIEQKTEKRAGEVIGQLVPRQQGGMPIAFDFAYHKDIYDQVCGERFINRLTDDLKEQEIVRQYYAGFISRHSHDQMFDWFKPILEEQNVQIQTLIENAKKMEERLALYESRVQAVIPIERPRMEGIIIPDIACGHEEDYHLFMRGRLVYRPDPKSDEGMITLPIANLINPLGGYPEGTFDLSGCGYTGQYLSINAGYRKGKITDNANKVEIWFVPRFMVFNQNQQKFPTPPQFKDIEDRWTHTVGIIWTWGGWANLSSYNYLTNESHNTQLDLRELGIRHGALSSALFAMRPSHTISSLLAQLVCQTAHDAHGAQTCTDKFQVLFMN